MKTAVEYIIDELSSRFDIVRNNLLYIQDVVKKAKEMEHKQIEEAIADGYAGCCGKKATVKLKGNFWERKESWDKI